MPRFLATLLLASVVYAQQDEFRRRRFEVIAPLIRSYKHAEAADAARALMADIERALGKDSLEYARSETQLVDALIRLGQTSEIDSKAAALHAASVKEKLLGDGELETVHAWENLTQFLVSIEDRADAERLYERILSAYSSRFGQKSTEFARALNRAAVHYFTIAEYAKARTLSERAMRISASDSLEMASQLSTFGFILSATGDHGGARKSLETALRIRQSKLGEEDRLSIASLNNLAIELSEFGDARRAIPLYERANALRMKLLGPEHPANAIGLHNLALALERGGDPEGALRVIGAALSLRRRTLGIENALTASSEGLAGHLHVKLLNAVAGRPMLEHALGVYRRHFGEAHPDTLSIERDLAGALAALGQTAAAFDLAGQAAGAWVEIVRTTARSLAERNAIALVSEDRWYSTLDLATSLALGHPELGGEARARTWELWMHSRALVLDEVATRIRTAQLSGDPTLQGLQLDLSLARQELSRLVMQRGAPVTAERLAGAQSRKENAERALAAKSLPLRSYLERSHATLQSVSAALPPRGALAAFVRFRRVAESGTVRDFVAAFVLSAGGGHPALIPIGPASEVDGLVAEWREEIRRESLAPGRSPRMEARSRLAGERLRRMVWDPLRKSLGRPESVFLVPDGSLHLVNFSALPAPGQAGKYLIETGVLLHTLSAERDLIAKPNPRMGSGLLALGNPSFGARASAGTHRGAGCAELRNMNFSPLPGTALEISEVAALWKQGPVVRLTGMEAKEPALYRDAPGKRVLHLATHGFFLAEPCGSGGRRAAMNDNPLLLSGLAMASANGRSAHTSQDDGIVTAEEIAGMNLDGVEWVVLSGCDTGLGRISGAEGVLGLRRAFQTAGAGTVILSLWPVEDETARQWMRLLYEARARRGMTTAQSVRFATLSLLRQRRAAGLGTHPFEWAAFTASGQSE